MSRMVVDIEVDKTNGQVAVKRIVCAHDCGLIVNPDGVKNQIEGNVIQGVSRALFEEVMFDANGVSSLDWSSYPILRFTDLPPLDVVSDQPARHRAARRRRTGNDSYRGVHRQRDFRCDRRALVRGTLHRQARARGDAENSLMLWSFMMLRMPL